MWQTTQSAPCHPSPCAAAATTAWTTGRWAFTGAQEQNRSFPGRDGCDGGCSSGRVLVSLRGINPVAALHPSPLLWGLCSPGTRLDEYKNIPVPTSYMAMGSGESCLCNTKKEPTSRVGPCLIPSSARSPTPPRAAPTPLAAPTPPTQTRTSLAATITARARGWCTWHATTSQPARSNGLGATTRLGGRGGGPGREVQAAAAAAAATAAAAHVPCSSFVHFMALPVPQCCLSSPAAPPLSTHSHTWDRRNLTDEDGSYIELMAGVYTGGHAAGGPLGI